MSIAGLIKKVRKQKALYWEMYGSDPNGKPVFKDPVELDVRWTDIDQDVMKFNGRDYVTKSKVMPDRVLVLGSVIRLGDVTTWISPLPPTVAEGGLEVVVMKQVPDFKAKNFYLEAIVGKGMTS